MCSNIGKLAKRTSSSLASIQRLGAEIYRKKVLSGLDLEARIIFRKKHDRKCVRDGAYGRMHERHDICCRQLIVVKIYVQKAEGLDS